MDKHHKSDKRRTRRTFTPAPTKGCQCPGSHAICRHQSCAVGDGSISRRIALMAGEVTNIAASVHARLLNEARRDWRFRLACR